MRTRQIAAAVIGTFVLAAGAGLANDTSLPANAAETGIADGATSASPPGFVGFCIRNRDICTRHAAASARIALTGAVRAKLNLINDEINRSIAYETDEEQYGIANVWTLKAVGGFGNCKDYALAKRQALIAAGYPDSALRIAIVRMQDGELHAVLTVDTDQGDLVLDSITPEILPWSETGYRWLERQSAEDPLRWVHVPYDNQ